MMLCIIHASTMLFAGAALCADADGILVQSRAELALAPYTGAAAPQAVLALTAVLIEDSGWREVELAAGINEALTVFAQCGVAAVRVALLRVTAPAPYRDLSNPESRTLAAALAAARPTLFFVRDTRNRPAFDAEAFGTGNTRSRPELEHSVWITRQAPDLAETLAHELYHVLANSGAHSDDAANLMHPRTAPGRRRLTPAQCAGLLEAGLQSGLLQRQ